MIVRSVNQNEFVSSITETYRAVPLFIAVIFLIVSLIVGSSPVMAVAIVVFWDDRADGESVRILLPSNSSRFVNGQRPVILSSVLAAPAQEFLMSSLEMSWVAMVNVPSLANQILDPPNLMIGQGILARVDHDVCLAQDFVLAVSSSWVKSQESGTTIYFP
jgi:hypothetical protein